MVKKFVDDKYQNLVRDIDKVRKRTNMYIGYRGEAGALHLSKELINNMIDEMINEKSPADTTWVTLRELDNSLTVTDNGRGIPFEELENVCTLLQSGSKMDRDGGGGTAGENGVGLTATNALSQLFEISSTRYNEQRKLTFSKGDKLSDEIIKQKGNGSTFTFVPDNVVLSNGKELPIIREEGLREWLKMISYLLPEGMKIIFEYIPKEGVSEKTTFSNVNGQGILPRVKELYSGKFVSKPYSFKDTIDIKEDARGVVNDRQLTLEVAFAVHDKNSEIQKDSFCNFVNTIDHGTHMEAVEQTIANEFSRITRDNLSDRDKENLTIKYSDVYASLVVVVNVNTDVDPQFSGQVKEKVGSTLISLPIRQITRDAIRDFMDDNPKMVDKITKTIRSNARDRYASDKLRDVRKNVSNVSKLDMLRNKKYIPPRIDPKNNYSEILVVEGMSAGQSIHTAGMDFQAAMQLKGVPINALTKTEARVIGNEEIATFIAATGGGVGPEFNIKKFVFDRVIIMTDGDIDGNKIFSSFLVFLMVYMPDLVKEKRVFRVQAPLYQIDDSDDEFVLDKRHYAEIFLRNIGNNVRLIDRSGDYPHQLTEEEFKEFLEINTNYLDELRQTARLFNAHPDIIEFIAYYYTKDHDKFKEMCVKEGLDEMSIERDGTFSGIYQGEFQFIMINRRFMTKIKPLIDTLQKNRAVKYEAYNKTRNGYEYVGLMTIGELMNDWEQFQPKIIKRFKGLGELKPEELQDRVLSPKNRLLVRITTDDMERAMEVMHTLHGDRNEDREARRKMIDNHVIHWDDIDN